MTRPIADAAIAAAACLGRVNILGPEHGGSPVAPAPGMAGFRRFDEIGAWQRAHELKLQIYQLCKRTPFERDPTFRNQLIDAARSGPRNIAEGFARWRHRDFARFTRIAKASETELLNHIRDAHDCGYISLDERKRLEHTSSKAIKAANGLIRYLEKTLDVDRTET